MNRHDLAASDATLEQQLADRTRELTGALEQQTATAEILRVISQSPTDVEPVLRAVADAAAGLCRANEADVFVFKDGAYRWAASAHIASTYVDVVRGEGFKPGNDSLVGRTALHGTVVQIEDAPNDPDYGRRDLARLGGARTLLGVPLQRDSVTIGVMVLTRRHVERFTDKHIEVLKIFADQAVIAIENVRLFTELRESLEQQTASTEILRVISQSPTNVQPVLDAVAKAALRFCGAADAVITLRDGGEYMHTAHEGVLTAAVGVRRPLDRSNSIGRAIVDDRTVHLPDLDALDPAEWSAARALSATHGFKAAIATPMLRDDVAIGGVLLRKTEAGPFTPRQIQLLEAFAAQAVIAIENVRLFNEVQALNKDLEAKVAAQVDELERVGRLRRFLAPQLAQAIVSAGHEGILGNHRREIVALFCDMRGFTAFSETSEPEDIMQVLAEYHGALGPLIRTYEGTLDRFTGDGMMVFFNDPLPCADAPERAARLAIEMRDAVARLGETWRKRGHRLGFGIGMAQGYATLGRIGFEDRFDYTAIGAVINLAARLCAEAEDGQVLVSGRLAAAAEAVAEIEELGERQLKGMARPVGVVCLRALKA
jgi:class 3 adenylate cyclase